nr:pilus assembly protein PilM [Lachnospiraceae bacterium]
NHKAERISADIIATFLPDEVVDGLYKAVGMAGLRVANLTLEPIAAMEVAIPESYRMLNIALVDVGAGTSDICITKDETIVAYGMIPSAGDEITEVIAKEYLVEFKEAEHIKRSASLTEPIIFHDIMGLEQTVTPEEVKKTIEPCINTMTKEIADRIKKLNGDKSVSAVFVVGGGGKAPGFTEALAKELDISCQRVAVRGEEVLKAVDFKVDVKQDSLLVTPIGICLNFYNMKNNFIFLDFNGEQIKLYDNSNLRISDAAMQAGFSNEDLFPKRGNEIRFTMNGKKEVRRGDPGDAAVIKLNGKIATLSEKVKAGDSIEITPSTAGAPVTVLLDKLPGFTDTISVNINKQLISLPKFALVNGVMKNGYYEIQDGDQVEMRKFYSVEQILDFMDVQLEEGTEIYVNHEIASPLTEVYDNFTVDWTLKEQMPSYGSVDEAKSEAAATEEKSQMDKAEAEASVKRMMEAVNKAEAALNASPNYQKAKEMPAEEPAMEEADQEEEEEISAIEKPEDALKKLKDKIAGKLEEKPILTGDIEVIVNNQPVRMTGKDNYIYVDVFNYIDFDRSTPHGTSVATKINGRDAEFVEQLHNGDRLEIYWRND